MSHIRTLTLPLDDDTPGGVYLCQVREGVSCGACCGLYNLADCSRTNLKRLLQARSLRFAGVARTAEGIENFARATLRLEPQQRPFADFHHCPFMGWMGSDSGGVGCLLHPLAQGNRGIDFRGLSYYGGLACRTYFCPTTHELSTAYKKIVRMAAADWYAYGLLITETELLRHIFGHLEMRLQQPLNADHFTERPSARDALMRLLGLKIDWPFHPPDGNGLCHYFFKENPHPRPAIDYRRLGVRPSDVDGVLRELVSEFSSVDRLRQAEMMIEQGFQQVVRELRYASRGRR